MKVMREIKVTTDHFEVGDRIKVKLPENIYTATAILDEDDGMLFILDQYLDEAMAMNKNGKINGGYGKSDMREHLQEVAETFPDKLKKRMVRFSNGDFLRLLSVQEMCGKDKNLDDCEGQIPYMKQDRRHRIASRRYGENDSGWLSTVVLGMFFARVTHYGGVAFSKALCYTGVRPVFKLCPLHGRILYGG